MKKTTLLLPLLLSFAMAAQTTLTINSLSVTGVDPVPRGGTFNFEIKYQADGPINADIHFWMSFFNKKEYDAWFINETKNFIEVKDGEENKEKIVNLTIDFPKETLVEKYKPNGFGKHDKFKIKKTSKLRKGEDYQLRVFVDSEHKIVNASSTSSNTNIDNTFIQKREKVCFFVIPDIVNIE